MRIVLAILCLLSSLVPGLAQESSPASKTVYIIPVRDDIMPPLVYLVRRGVKEAMQAKAEMLVLDMETNGGRVDTTEEIITILNRFQGKTVTYVNRKAFSAGAFIAVATQKIYMAPQSVIGAAAPLLLAPGSGPVEMSDTMEAKMTSGIRALVRANAERNGHNVDVVEAMIDKNKELKIDGEVLNEKGQILTLTSSQAEKKYGEPPKPLLSSGTAENLESLLKTLGYGNVKQIYINATGVEKLASWVNKISPLLLMIGVIGIYLEMKTPGFGLPGIVGISAFAIYFLGGYVAGLSGMEWIAVFIIGLTLIILELFVFPGTILVGLLGSALVLASIVMAMVDIYPHVPGVPASIRFRVPFGTILLNLFATVFGSLGAIWLLSRFLPKTALYGSLISSRASGETFNKIQVQQHSKQIGEIGVTVSALRPGGKAQFGDRVLDVISQGEMIPKNSNVKIIGHSANEAIVEIVNRPTV